jgi:MFS family permease
MATTGTSRKHGIGIRTPVAMVGWVSFFTDFSSHMIASVLPLFLTAVLRIQLETIGLMEGVAESTASLLKLFSGWLSDHLRRRKPLMVAGYGLSNGIKPLFALSSTWWQVLGLRFLDRFGKGIRGAPRDALLADLTTKEERGRAFGFRRAMDTLGAAVGPLAAYGILSFDPGNYRAVFWTSSIPGFLAVLLLVFFVKERRASPQPEKSSVHFPLRGFGKANRRFVGFTVIATVFAVANFSDAFLILRAKDVGMKPAYIPLAYLLFNLVCSLFSVPAGAVSDRMGRRPVLAAGYFLFAAIYLGFGFARDEYGIWVLFFLYGLYYAATEGIQKAYIADLVPEEQRGEALGLFSAWTGLAALPASIIAGFLWQNFGAVAAFGASGILAGTAALAFVLLRL